MFEFNEAPNQVLAAISTHETKRSCGTFWSSVFCLPTCGISMGACEEHNPEWMACCYPRPVGIESKMGLYALTDVLNQIRMSQKELSMISEKESKNKVIEWQVRETIKVLETAQSDNVIQGSYKTMLNAELKKIKTRAHQEEKFMDILNQDKIPLTDHDFHVPEYGHRSTRTPNK